MGLVGLSSVDIVTVSAALGESARSMRNGLGEVRTGRPVAASSSADGICSNESDPDSERGDEEPLLPPIDDEGGELSVERC